MAAKTKTVAAATETKKRGFVAVCRDDQTGKPFVAGVRASVLPTEEAASKLARETAAEPANRFVAEVELPEGW